MKTETEMGTRDVRLLGVAVAAMLFNVTPLAGAQIWAQDSADRTETAVPVTTAPKPTPSPRPFEALDQNADGGISKDEAAVDPPLAQVFGTLDKDADGRLTPEEYAVHAQGTP